MLMNRTVTGDSIPLACGRGGDFRFGQCHLRAHLDAGTRSFSIRAAVSRVVAMPTLMRRHQPQQWIVLANESRDGTNGL